MGKLGIAWRNFLLLLWKNWVLQKRHVLQTVIEVAAPVLCTAILVAFRTLVTPETYEGVHFKPFDPSNLSSPSDWSASVWQKPFRTLQYNVTSIAYSPCGNPHIDNIMTLIQHPLISIRDCEKSARNLEGLVQTDSTILAGVEFRDSYGDSNELPKNIDIKLRFPGELRTSSAGGISISNWKTFLLYPMFQMAGPRNRMNDFGADPEYYKEGFLSLQKAVSRAFIQVAQSQTGSQEITDIPNIVMQRYPYPGWVFDPMLDALQGFVGLIIMLSFFYTCVKTVQVITTEKEKQLKESMKIMGLPSWLHWTAWFTKTFIFLLITISLMTGILKIIWVRDPDLAVFTHGDGLVIFIFLLIYMFATTTFCFAISTLFTKANTAATVAGLLWFVSYVPYTFMAQEYNEDSAGKKVMASLLSNTAMGYGFQLIVMWEATEEGIQFSNIWKTISPDDDLMLGHIMLILILDGILYLLIALYVESVFPGEYGVPKPWYYPVSKSYWCGTGYEKVGSMDNMENGVNEDRTIFETEPTDREVGVRIQHLRKVYANNKVAVRDMNLNMYKGQITALLGHNGAGKTTTMSILTGMFQPTSGTAYVAGFDIRNQIDEARSSLGLCPQHNILFDELTVEEHLYFFGKLKGLSGDEIKSEIDRYIRLLELEPKRHVNSSALSGGMKRKLSVGVALCGNSKVVMLDEPTAGMDPAARRAIWDILQEQKQGRTILLTTHFMDEADLLGDRIAIMAGGQLQCCGSSFFLKKRYGAGYHLIMEKLAHCDVTKVTAILAQYIPGIKVENNVGSELTYLLSEEYVNIFEKMLSELETRSGEVGVASYGISLSTLEEVFIQVGADHGQEEINNALENSKKNNYMNNLDDNSQSSNTKLDMENIRLVAGMPLLRNQTWAMMVKKALSLWRSWYLYIIQFFIAVVFMVLTIIIIRNMPTGSDQPALQISLDTYDTPVTVIGSPDLTDKYYKKMNEYLQRMGHVVEDIRTADIEKHMWDRTIEITPVVRNRYLAGATMNPTTNELTAWFNNNPYHTPPLALLYAANVVLKTTVSDEYSITITNYPIPYSISAKFKELNQGNGAEFQIAFNLAFSMSIISAFYILFYIRERVIKAKHLQFVSGVNTLTFWVTAYIWDMFTYLLLALSVIITLAAFQEEGYATASELGRVFVFLLVFGISMLPLNYLCSFLFETPSTGFTRMVLINVFLGAATLILTQVLGLESLDLRDVERGLHWTFLFVPLYSMGAGIRDTGSLYAVYNLCYKFVKICMDMTGGSEEVCWAVVRSGTPSCNSTSTDYFGLTEDKSSGRNIIISMVMALVLIAVLLLKEYEIIGFAWLHRLKSPKKLPSQDANALDADVQQEGERINMLSMGEIREHRIVLRNLSKYYKNFLAVDRINLGVGQFECFGLLGVNGAGKTTTFKMMTGDVPMSSGQGWAGGFDLSTQIKQVHRIIGYCPQFDALLDDLTGRETLKMFGLLRGIPSSEVNFVAEKLSREVDFHRHLDKKVKEYSGGNKRKLSTAVALIGDPPIVFLDEPTTGMDPATKRNLWNALCRVRDSGKCLVLTSHSMEECEALCTRIAIMVNGQFKCLGSTQHLKNKFSEGYTLTVKLRKVENLDETANAAAVFVQSQFPSAVLREHYQELLTFYIADRTMPWSRMFGVMENAKKQIGVEDYSLGQATLEQVFLQFTKLQR